MSWTKYMNDSRIRSQGQQQTDIYLEGLTARSATTNHPAKWGWSACSQSSSTKAELAKPQIPAKQKARDRHADKKKQTYNPGMHYSPDSTQITPQLCGRNRFTLRDTSLKVAYGAWLVSACHPEHPEHREREPSVKTENQGHTCKVPHPGRNAVS